MTNPDDHGDSHDVELDEVGRLLRHDLVRHRAPARLRVAVAEILEPPESRRRPSLWLPPALAALATAMAMLLWLVPALPRGGSDSLQRFSQAVMTEHARAVLWGESRPETVPAVLPRVMEESGVVLNWVFTGD